VPEELQGEIGKSGGIPPLVRLFSNPANQTIQMMSLRALSNLSDNCAPLLMRFAVGLSLTRRSGELCADGASERPRTTGEGFAFLSSNNVC
jgi:hypothetical protein